MSCEWPVDRTCLPTAVSDVDKLKQQAAEDGAVQILWALFGRGFGVCPVIAGPCPTWCLTLCMEWVGPGCFPVMQDGSWRNIGCGCACPTGAGCCNYAGPSVIHLPGPVQSITQ